MKSSKKIIQSSQNSGNINLKLPVGGLKCLISQFPSLSDHKIAGLSMVGSIMWSHRSRRKDGIVIMRLVKDAALKFVDRVPGFANPVTAVATAWECELITKGRNINGKVTNTWCVPHWANGNTEKLSVRLSPLQRQRWNKRREILRVCLDKANPTAAIVRKTLVLTKAGSDFDETARRLTKTGERECVEKYLRRPKALNVTQDGDIQSNVSRLPESLRVKLEIDGLPVAEFDVKSAHAILLGMFYEDETGDGWNAEKLRFIKESKRGFASIYGEGKKWKVAFLAALNQESRIAHHASAGFRELERLFPLLAGKLSRMKSHDKNVVGRRLRVALAEIVSSMIGENDADGIHTIPVIDSAIVAMPEDPFQQHRAAFRTAWRLGVPIAKKTGATPTIEGSNGESFCFIL